MGKYDSFILRFDPKYGKPLGVFNTPPCEHYLKQEVSTHLEFYWN